MNVSQFCTLFTSGSPYEDVVKTIRKYLYRNNTDIILSLFQYISLYCINNNKGKVDLAKFILQCLQGSLLKPFKGTMTLTFGEVAESHVGMQKIGKMDERGFSYDELIRAQKYFSRKGCETLLVHLNNFLPRRCENKEENRHLQTAKTQDNFQAWILVAKNGLKCLTGDSEGKNLLTEMLMFEWDTKLYNERRKIVQNKLARHNLNFSNYKQKADFQHGKGTTISWNEVPLLKKLRKSLIHAYGDSAKSLKCEGNMYYAYGKTGIGYHGDTERRKVIGVRLGRPMTIHYMWYYNNSPRGMNVSILLGEGDVYCMSEKAVGTDWMAAPRKRYTLRHAAGADKYTTKTGKIWIKNRRELSENPALSVGDIYYKPGKSKTVPNPAWTNMSQYCTNETY